jgi:type II secretory pathway pseudopilin PulG
MTQAIKDKSKSKPLTGFTLVEMLIVSGIVVFLSAMVFINYNARSQELALLRSAYKLSQDVRRAGEIAMAAREFQGSIPPGGYGIYFSTALPDSYKLYADTNGNEKYDATDGIIETISLEKGVVIQGVSPASLSVNFKPPNPSIKIKTDAGAEVVGAVITLALKSDPTKIKTVIINNGGLSEVQ